MKNKSIAVVVFGFGVRYCFYTADFCCCPEKNEGEPLRITAKPNHLLRCSVLYCIYRTWCFCVRQVMVGVWVMVSSGRVGSGRVA